MKTQYAVTVQELIEILNKIPLAHRVEAETFGRVCVMTDEGSGCVDICGEGHPEEDEQESFGDIL